MKMKMAASAKAKMAYQQRHGSNGESGSVTKWRNGSEKRQMAASVSEWQLSAKYGNGVANNGSIMAANGWRKRKWHE